MLPEKEATALPDGGSGVRLSKQIAARSSFRRIERLDGRWAASVVAPQWRIRKKALDSKSRAFHRIWRRGWDSNPRYGETVRLISSQVHSTTLPPLLGVATRGGSLVSLAGRRRWGASSAGRAMAGWSTDATGCSPDHTEQNMSGEQQSPLFYQQSKALCVGRGQPPPSRYPADGPRPSAGHGQRGTCMRRRPAALFGRTVGPGHPATAPGAVIFCQNACSLGPGRPWTSSLSSCFPP